MTLLDRLRRFVTGTEDARVIRIEQAIADARMNWLEALLLEIAMGIAAARRFTPMHVENPSGEYVQAKIAATLAALQVAKSSLVLAFAGEVNAAELLGGMDALLGALDRLEVLIHEYLHHLWPDKAEEAVTEAADRLADFLHRQNVRITEPDGVSLKNLDFDAPK